MINALRHRHQKRRETKQILLLRAAKLLLQLLTIWRPAKHLHQVKKDPDLFVILRSHNVSTAVTPSSREEIFYTFNKILVHEFVFFLKAGHNF